MSKFKGLFQKAWAAVANPGQDERVAIILSAIERGLTTHKRAFDLDQTIEPIDCTVTDLQVATKKYYEKLLQRFWAQGVPDAGKQSTLTFVEERLRLDALEAEKIRERVVIAAFGTKLGEYLADGTLTDKEVSSLSEIASSQGMTVQQFVQQHLFNEGLGLLRGLFAEAVATGYLPEKTWNNLRESALRLGISEDKLKSASHKIATSFAEHVLADTKSDGLMSPKEETYLHWLATTFDFEKAFLVYLHDEIRALKDRSLLATGNIPTIPVPPGLNLKSGELLYFCQPCRMQLTRVLKHEERIDEHKGQLLMTDSRLVFESASKSVQIFYSSIVAWRASTDVIRVSAANKPELRFYFARNPNSLLEEKLSTVIRLHSQQLKRKIEGTIDRHIPRDVRQRVWQTYGGMCVECGATEYLEFDHIVPVARGGSNSEQNVQLLCRKCNLSKSDKI